MSLPVPPEVAVPVLKDLFTAAAQYQMCKEHEHTERLRIETQLEECLAKINSDHQKFLLEMEENRESMRLIYDSFEKLLDRPEIYTNPTLLQALLNFLQNLHTTYGAKFISIVNAHSSANTRRRFDWPG